MFVDTSVLVDLIIHPGDHPGVQRIRDLVGPEPLYASPIQMGELADWARRTSLSPEALVARARDSLEFVPLSLEIAVAASALKAEVRKSQAGRRFSLIDGIVLASARSISQRILTRDRGFPPAPDVEAV